MDSQAIKPTLNWGIIGAGMISEWFVADLLIERSDAKANHNVVAIGCSSNFKAKSFLQKLGIHNGSVNIGSYNQVYSNPKVDIVYIGLHNPLHKKECLNAIQNNKHVLVEKPATMNAKDFKEVITAAKEKKVFFMEGMWIRFQPIIFELQNLLLKDRLLGELYRMLVDFSLEFDYSNDRRFHSNQYSISSLLGLGIYSLNYARFLLDDKLGENHTPFEVKGFLSVSNGIDFLQSGIMKYKSTQRQAVFLSSFYTTNPREFARIDCELGSIIISGNCASEPTVYRIEFKDGSKTIEKYFNREGMGFYYEADAVALDIASGKLENDIFPWSENLLILEVMDKLRQESGVSFPQDG